MIRIATVGYLNARPLTSYIDRDRFEVIEGYPSEIARLLAEGAVDVALVPVAAVLNDGDFRILPGVCVGADGPVGSVLLVSEVPPERWTEVLLDQVSRTSVTLARLLLTQGPLRGQVLPELVIEACAAGRGVDLARGTTACLVIGDEAMDLPDRLVHRVDLAEVWKRWTGLPFVFAVWAGRADLPVDVRLHLQHAGERGLQMLSQDYAGDDLVYLTESLRHSLDERALIGLRRYAALAQRAGLVASDTVQLFGPTERSFPRPDVGAALLLAADGHDLSAEQALALDGASLTDLMAAADQRRAVLRPGSVVWTPCVEVVL
ncbi:MAG: chorismate dehydratase, partial [Kiritimatiellia bacterium]